MNRPLLSKAFMLAAFIFLLIDTLLVGGVLSSHASFVWLLPAGLTSMALAFVVA